MAKIEVKCDSCGLPHYLRNEKTKTFQCVCGKRNIVNKLDNDLENIKNEEKILEEKAENLKFEIKNIDSAYIPKNDNIETTPIQPVETIKPVTNQEMQKIEPPKTKPFSSDTLKKYPEQLNALMRKKVGAEIWDVSTKEEIILSEQWADVLNEYLPNAKTKEAKLILASLSTFTVYTPRIIDTVSAYMKKKKEKKENNLGLSSVQETQKQIEEIKQQEPIMKQNNQDDDFINRWKSKGGK